MMKFFLGVDGLKTKFEKIFCPNKKIFEMKIFFKVVSRFWKTPKFHVFIFDLLAFSGKIFLQKSIQKFCLQRMRFVRKKSFLKHEFAPEFMEERFPILVPLFFSSWEVYILEPLFFSSWERVPRRIWREFPTFFILSSSIEKLFHLKKFFSREFNSLFSIFIFSFIFFQI